MSLIKWEDSSKLNANNSRWLGLATIVLFILGCFLPWITNNVAIYHEIGFKISAVVLAVGTYLTAVKVGFPNTFETNDDWKTWVQIASAICNIIVPCTFIVSYTSIIR